jgi:hypothetical protein
MNFEVNKNNFEVNKNQYFDTLHQNHYIFELTKTCGYSEWVVVHKKSTCAELFTYVGRILQNDKFEIFVKDMFGNKFVLKGSNYVLYDMLITNHSFFRPVYPLPQPVVYKLFLDDGHQH